MMMRYFIVPIFRLFDKCSEEYIEGCRDQHQKERLIHMPKLEKNEENCTSCAYNKKPNSNK